MKTTTSALVWSILSAAITAHAAPLDGTTTITANSDDTVSSSSTSSSTIAAVATPTIQVTRHDRPDPFSKSLIPTTFTAKHKSLTNTGGIDHHRIDNIDPNQDFASSSSNSNSLGSTNSPFQIDFTCKNASNETCIAAQQAFISAGSRIAAALTIGSVIRVSALFHSFCDGVVGLCSRKDTLGQASAAAYFGARPATGPAGAGASGPYYFYPQALVKQLKQDYALQFNDYDIVAEFNSDFNFWFSSSETPIQPGQTDFEFVVAHELTHGMGFESGLLQWSTTFQDLPKIPSSNFLAPLFNAHGTTLSNSFVTSWQPLNIFDAFLADTKTGTALTTYANDIFKYVPKNQSITNFIDGFQSSKEPFQAANKLYNIATSGSTSISFNPKIAASSGSSPASLSSVTAGGFNNVNSINLQTSTLFSPGTSVVHVDYASLNTSPDFLMIPAVGVWSGFSLDAILANVTQSGNVYGVYGEGIMSCMAAMGWVTVKTPGGAAAAGYIDINPNPDRASVGTSD
ncbi:hypothetical protein HDU76_012613, partial [Blyttiomyces sp. JEL0837]